MNKKKKKRRKRLRIKMSIDQKPDLASEKLRIEKAGGYVEQNRVDGGLNLGRSLGDLTYKVDKKLPIEEQKVIPVPEIKVEKISKDTPFLVVACDGIWDCVES